MEVAPDPGVEADDSVMGVRLSDLEKVLLQVCVPVIQISASRGQEYLEEC